MIILILFKGPLPSNDEPEGPYPTIVDHGTRKTLIVQDYFAGKYLGFLNITFDSNNNVESWDGLPILLDNNTLQGTIKKMHEDNVFSKVNYLCRLQC